MPSLSTLITTYFDHYDEDGLTTAQLLQKVADEVGDVAGVALQPMDVARVVAADTRSVVVKVPRS